MGKWHRHFRRLSGARRHAAAAALFGDGQLDEEGGGRKVPLYGGASGRNSGQNGHFHLRFVEQWISGSFYFYCPCDRLSGLSFGADSVVMDSNWKSVKTVYFLQCVNIKKVADFNLSLQVHTVF